ncbi:MAG: hypothetical protein CME36_16250 [unclassified Hahellaceae]|nr:hypothetical protein [Hahellaceae bacterium]|tara:strand:- start:95052 stop:95405 length:354 start_codon:yes stop_codon:yes gene_type:complete
MKSMIISHKFLRHFSCFLFYLCRSPPRLLGDLPEATYFKWKSALTAKPGRDILERISHLQNIYKALRIIFPTLEQATAWPLKPNAAFGGKSALEVMLNGSILDLARVYDYVDGARGW